MALKWKYVHSLNGYHPNNRSTLNPRTHFSVFIFSQFYPMRSTVNPMILLFIYLGIIILPPQWTQGLTFLCTPSADSPPLLLPPSSFVLLVTSSQLLPWQASLLVVFVDSGKRHNIFTYVWFGPMLIVLLSTTCRFIPGHVHTMDISKLWTTGTVSWTKSA